MKVIKVQSFYARLHDLRGQFLNRSRFQYNLFVFFVDPAKRRFGSAFSPADAFFLQRRVFAFEQFFKLLYELAVAFLTHPDF